MKPPIIIPGAGGIFLFFFSETSSHARTSIPGRTVGVFGKNTTRKLRSLVVSTRCQHFYGCQQSSTSFSSRYRVRFFAAPPTVERGGPRSHRVLESPSALGRNGRINADTE